MKLIEPIYHGEPTFKTRYGVYVNYVDSAETESAYMWAMATFGYAPKYAVDRSWFSENRAYYWFEKDEDRMVFMLRWT